MYYLCGDKFIINFLKSPARANFMQFGINWNDGYEVVVHMSDDRGLVTWHPLRNFGDRQGDAKIFKLVDCPILTDSQLRMLVKHFDRSVKYERINGKHFVKQFD